MGEKRIIEDDIARARKDAEEFKAMMANENAAYADLLETLDTDVERVVIGQVNGKDMAIPVVTYIDGETEALMRKAHSMQSRVKLDRKDIDKLTPEEIELVEVIKKTIVRLCTVKPLGSNGHLDDPAFWGTYVYKKGLSSLCEVFAMLSGPALGRAERLKNFRSNR